MESRNQAKKRMSESNETDIKRLHFFAMVAFFRFAVSFVKKAFLYRKKSADQNIPDSRLFNLYALDLDF